MADESEPKKVKSDLSNTHTFTIDVTAISGEEYKGTFIVHRPTIGEQIKIGVREAQELGGLANIDSTTAILAHILSTLDTVIDKAPVWWKPKELRDLEVVQVVYENFINYLQTFQTKS